MSQSILRDIEHFFSVYQSRNYELLSRLPAPVRAELEEEMLLLKRSVLNRLKEDHLS